MKRAVAAWVLGLSIGTWAPQASAQADVALVLEAGGDAGAEAGAPALAGVREGLAARGLTFEDVQGGCAALECASEALAARGARVAVAVAVWSRRGAPPRVSVSLTDAAGRVENGGAEASDGGVLAAARAALDAAWVAWSAGGMASLRVEGTPRGATVTVDRVPFGTLPHEGMLAFGEHALSISAEGHRTVRRAFTLGPEGLVVREDLDEAARGPDAAALAVASGLALGGLGGVLLGAVRLAEGTRCEGSPALCHVPDDAAVAAWMGAGGALLIGAVVWVAVLLEGGDGT